MRLFIVCWLGLIPVCGTCAERSPVPEVVVPFRVDPIVIDGFLDDVAWQDSGSISIRHDWKGRLLDNESDESAVHLVWSREGIWLGYSCPDEDLQALNSRHDGRIWKGDVVEFFISPNSNCYPYLEVLVNPDNVVFDCLFLSDERKTYGLPFSKTWDAKSLQSAVSYEEGIWFVEIFLPWEEVPAMNFEPHVGARFRCQFNRYLCESEGRPKVFHTAWSPPRLKQGRPHVPESFGWLTLGPIE